MNAHPLISVVVPAYNAARFLAETLQSVLAQTYQNWELLIINDGSTDNTAEIAEQYRQHDRRIRLYSQPNQGVSAARNLGVELAQGELIAFLDADDRWLPEKLATHVGHLAANPSIGVSFAKVRYLRANGTPTSLIATASLVDIQSWDFIYANPTITTSNVVIRKEIFQQLRGFDPTMSYSEDMDLFFRILCNSSWKIEGIEPVLVEYRTQDNGLSSSLYRMEAGWQTLASKARELAPEIIEQHYKPAYANYLRYLARQSLRLGLSGKTGIDFINRALKTDWNILLREPKRTSLTALSVYLKYYLNDLYRVFKVQ